MATNPALFGCDKIAPLHWLAVPIFTGVGVLSLVSLMLV